MNRSILIASLFIISVYSLTLLLPQATFLSYSYEKDAIVVHGPKFLHHLANFDGVHYQNIAINGYYQYHLAAFFPFFPLLIKSFSFLTNNPLISALFISLISTVLSFVFLFKITNSYKPLILLAVYPFSFFLLASYTESLFLALTLISLYFYQKKKYYPSLLFGILSTATRVYGIFFVIYLLLYNLKNLSLLKKRLVSNWHILLMPLGLISYMFFLFLHSGDPLQFTHALDAWNKSEPTFPLITVYRYLRIFITVEPFSHVYLVAVSEFLSLIVGFAALIYLLLKRKYSDSVYVLLSIAIPLITGTLQSLPRYLLVVFPIFFIAKNIPKAIFYPLCLILALLSIFFFNHFLNTRFIS